jgi:hypothetical protein
MIWKKCRAGEDLLPGSYRASKTIKKTYLVRWQYGA